MTWRMRSAKGARRRQDRIGAGPASGARPRLDDGQAGGRMRHEHVQQAVAAPRHHLCGVAGEVEHDLLAARAIGAGLAVHAGHASAVPAPASGSPTSYVPIP